MGQLTSDSQALSRSKTRGGDRAADIAKQLPDRVDRAKLDPWQMKDLFEIGRAVGQDDMKSSETLMGSTEDERGEIYGKLTAAAPRLLQVPIDAEQPGTQSNQGRSVCNVEK